MDTLGSFAITAGTPLRLTCDLAARWVSLRNDSPNYLYVQCGPRGPNSPLSPGSYLLTIAPWSGDNYDTSSELSPFDGVVYLLPSLLGGLANPGLTLTRNVVSVTTYSAGETPPQPYAGIARQQDLTSQPRIVTIPMTMAQGNSATGRVATPTGGNSINIGSTFSTLGLIGVQVAFYVYYYEFTPGFNPVAAGGMDAGLFLDCQTAGNATIGFPFPVLLHEASLAWSGLGQVYQVARYNGPYPIAVQVVAPAGKSADHFTFTFKNGSAVGAPPQFDYYLAASLDPSNNANVPGAIGNSEPNGALF